ncbi:MAG: WD40 repeat domain-containing protein [Bacteroidetes bacterium]|nr:WD40 repeat domain-containing protein [Bacteroidota bacterium]
MTTEVKRNFLFAGHRGGVYALARGKDPSVFFSGSSDKFVVAWNAETGEQEKFAAQFPAPVYALRFLEEKNILLVGAATGSLHFIDLEKREEIKVLQLHSAQIFDVAYSPKNDLIITAGGDGQITFLNGKTLELIKAIKLCSQKVRNVVIDPSEEKLAVASGDGNITIFSLPGMEELFSFHAHNLSANALAWNSAGTILLSGGRDAYLKAWNAEKNFSLLTAIPAHNFAIYSIVFSPDGKLFATGSRDKTIKLWDAENIRLLLRINKETHDAHANSVNRLLWNEKGLFSASDDNVIMKWMVSYGL